MQTAVTFSQPVLSDVEKRYRQRYVDMIVTPGVTDTFRTRARITSVIRRELESRSFLEVKDFPTTPSTTITTRWHAADACHGAS